MIIILRWLSCRSSASSLTAASIQSIIKWTECNNSGGRIPIAISTLVGAGCSRQLSAFCVLRFVCFLHRDRLQNEKLPRPKLVARHLGNRAGKLGHSFDFFFFVSRRFSGPRSLFSSPLCENKAERNIEACAVPCLLVRAKNQIVSKHSFGPKPAQKARVRVSCVAVTSSWSRSVFHQEKWSVYRGLIILSRAALFRSIFVSVLFLLSPCIPFR